MDGLLELIDYLAVVELLCPLDGDSLGQAIDTVFSRFSYPRLIARNSTERFAGEAGDVRAIGRELRAAPRWREAVGRRVQRVRVRAAC